MAEADRLQVTVAPWPTVLVAAGAAVVVTVSVGVQAVRDAANSTLTTPILLTSPS
ncbi:MAG: hypothetical protein WD269_08060 [Acidimicrobiia bacterium]